MSIALILAASLAATPAAAPAAATARPPRAAPVDQSLSDVGRLAELRIAVRTALKKGEIDEETAAQLNFGIQRVQRQIFRMGMQFGYRQRVRVRTRIDRLYAQLEQRRAAKRG